jgi:catechol 2,3-dioxygenase-like lactoylglutathione lyase family enzyme
MSFNVFVQHVGITVSDLDRSLAFYRDNFGLEPSFVMDLSGPELEAAIGVPGADLRLAFLPAGSTFIELLQYNSPTGQPYALHNYDAGASHVALGVDDVQVAYEELTAKGVTFVAAPGRTATGPLAGTAYAYLKDPDGITIELFQSTPLVQSALAAARAASPA